MNCHLTLSEIKTILNSFCKNGTINNKKFKILGEGSFGVVIELTDICNKYVLKIIE